LASGESVHAVARSLGVQPSTLRAWRKRLGADPLKEAEGEPDFRALVLHFAVEGLAAGERILGLTRDEVWLKEQRAGEVATLLGVTFDKVARVLAALPSPGDAGWENQVGEPAAAGALPDTAGGADPHS
jgi:transposase-like protein